MTTEAKPLSPPQSEKSSPAELLARHRRVLPNWVALYYQQPIELTRGEGRYVWDSEGNRYLDFFAGILTTSCGHAVPEIVEPIREQAGRMLHSSTLYLIESQVELAEEIAAVSGIPDAKVFFTNSGTEANDAALMLATGRRRSNQVLALRHSYHGRSHSTVGITGTGSWRPSSLSPFQVTWVHGGYRYRSPFRHLDDPAYIRACVDDLESLLDVGTSGDVACMIAEPIQGVGGFVTPPDGLLGAFHEVLSARGILFISDEVQTGWGRTGDHFWGYQWHGFTPDVLTFAKGIGNGLALGGLVASAELMDSLGASSISTFGGNPLATTGGLATLRYILDHDLQGNARERGAELRKALETIAERNPQIGDVRGKGLMLGVELVEPPDDSSQPGAPSPALASRVLEATREAGLLIGKGGLRGNVLRIAPPLSVTREEMREGIELLEQAFAAAVEA